jgi:catechol 2,3-dioxygenase-like lactoylglutathione lyase family enzyme
MTFSIEEIDHVNIRIPVGSEPEAKAFWVGILGFEDIPKPETDASPGGCWFRRGNFEIHVSPTTDFQPTARAHTAFRVEGLDGLVDKLEEEGIKHEANLGLTEPQRGYFLFDPFGNRFEAVT